LKKGSLGRLATRGKVEADVGRSRKKKFDVRENSTLDLDMVDDMFGDIGKYIQS
jgi:hypothetical protein